MKPDTTSFFIYKNPSTILEWCTNLSVKAFTNHDYYRVIIDKDGKIQKCQKIKVGTIHMLAVSILVFGTLIFPLVFTVSVLQSIARKKVTILKNSNCEDIYDRLPQKPKDPIILEPEKYTPTIKVRDAIIKHSKQSPYKGNKKFCIFEVRDYGSLCKKRLVKVEDADIQDAIRGLGGKSCFNLPSITKEKIGILKVKVADKNDALIDVKIPRDTLNEIVNKALEGESEYNKLLLFTKISKISKIFYQLIEIRKDNLRRSIFYPQMQLANSHEALLLNKLIFPGVFHKNLSYLLKIQNPDDKTIEHDNQKHKKDLEELGTSCHKFCKLLNSK